MIALNQLSMAFGQQLLFYDVNLNLNSNTRYALVGANGCGKSTFFKLIQGEEEKTDGEILIPKDASIGWLKQDQFRYENTRIRDIVIQGKPKLWAAMQEKEELLALPEWTDQTGFRFAALEEIIAHEDGYTAEGEADRILTGLGILPAYFEKPLNALSGGYKLRVLLAQVLFQNPSILLLDEPTNHLDIISIRWLEKFLKEEFKGLVIFISHDVEFIDHLCDYILDLDFGEIRQYRGPYQKFLDEKALLQEQKRIEKQSAEEKVKHLQSFVDRFKAKASKAAQARSRMKMIEKIEIPDIVTSSRKAPHFKFVPKKPSGRQVLSIKNLSKSFKEKKLFHKVNVEVLRGEKISIVGVNGVGKSTFIKLLTSTLDPDEGTITWGHEASISYFSQDHHDLLNRSCTALEWLTDSVSFVTEQQIRRALGQVLLTKDEVDKNILSLSGGEAARLLLAKVMLESPNILILDEPTNHMDLETIEALGHALLEYQGTVIAVSHNRHFMNQFSHRVFYFEPEKPMLDFRGKYSDFDDKYLTT